jgi:demethylmenaquinone methyltransferase/2-methoxy-6-polyprenyl-1,4-benzoquinol methylase
MTNAVPLPPWVASPADERTEEERLYYKTSADLYGSPFASFYDVIAFPLRWLRRRVVRLAHVTLGMCVLDVATGTGAQARAFAAVGARVVGIDLSTRMLAIARRKNRDPNTTFIEADATALPMPDESFDVGAVSLALHEMPPSVRSRAVHELARVTRRGGTVVVVDFARPRNRIWRAIVVRVLSLFERDAYPEFIRSDLRALLSQAGIIVREEHRAFLDTARIVVGVRR